MLEFPDNSPLHQEPYDDLRQRYSSGYFVLVNPKDKSFKPIYIAAFDRLDNDITVGYHVVPTTQEPIKSGEIPLIWDKLLNLDIHEYYPPKGLYNPTYMAQDTWNPVMFFQRTHKRQWKHGIKPDTCRINFPFVNIIDLFWESKVASHLVPWNLENFVDLFYPTYPKTRDEIFGILAKNPIVALSSEFGLMDSPIGEDYLLFVHDRFIGEANKDTLIVRENAFAQEVSDFVRRSNLDFRVTLA